jgi:hypothetical protein
MSAYHIVNGSRSLLIAVATLVSLFLFALPRATAAPLCSGPTSVTDLGTEGCTFDTLTFSDFSFSGQTGNPFSPILLNPDDVLVEMFDTALTESFLNTVPAIGLRVTPRDPLDWQTEGLFSSVNFALSYVVTSIGATLDRYQVGGTGIPGSLRGGRFSASMTAAAGDMPVSTGSLGPFLQIGNLTPGTTTTAVTTNGAASQGIALGGTTFISSVTNIFTVVAAPVPVPGSLALVAMGILAIRRNMR